jgi:hypothetical protein
MEQKLFMLLLGCTPKGRLTEQHDVFFGIAPSLKDLVEEITNFWPDAEGNVHIDVWREVSAINGHQVQITSKNNPKSLYERNEKIFFINLGGYKQNGFEEYHYKMLVLANDKSEATNSAKKSAFYLHTGFEGAPSHIDDKYGVDVDDVYEIEDIIQSI